MFADIHRVTFGWGDYVLFFPLLSDAINLSFPGVC